MEPPERENDGSPSRSFPGLLRDILRAGRESPAETAQRQQARLCSLIDFARRRSPYYARRYSALPPDVGALETLPPVTKEELTAHFDAWSTDPSVTRESAEAFVADLSRIGRLYLGRYIAFSTSGTSGRPAVFLHDPAAAAVYLALTAARRIPSLIAPASLGSFLKGRARTATIVTTGGHFTSSVVDALARSRFPLLSGRNRTFSLMDPLPALVRSLNDFRPAVVGSYPTALSVLAGEQQAGRLRIRPALVLSGAELLSTALAERISVAFGCPVRDTYAASEFMGIAFDCRHGRLHVNADWAILEPVDAAFRPVPPGEASHTTLLTNLANRVQPLIRYDLGDSITVIPSPCPCGSRLPSIRVEGRHDEVLFPEDGDGVRRPQLPLVLATVVEKTEGLRAYQVIQSGSRHLRVRAETAPGYARAAVCGALLRALRDHLADQGLEGVSIEISDDPPLRDTPGGKLRQFLVGQAAPGTGDSGANSVHARCRWSSPRYRANSSPHWSHRGSLSRSSCCFSLDADDMFC